MKEYGFEFIGSNNVMIKILDSNFSEWVNIAVVRDEKYENVLRQDTDGKLISRLCEIILKTECKDNCKDFGILRRNDTTYFIIKNVGVKKAFDKFCNSQGILAVDIN